MHTVITFNTNSFKKKILQRFYKDIQSSTNKKNDNSSGILGILLSVKHISKISVHKPPDVTDSLTSLYCL